ncbi:Inner-membrane translocator [Pseudodesulfovibrio profundus]|uniref:Inner-membrane translocator n=1 Tax=Pseudodesulfovibrio profundus TaxID=57320 RepID=A0A2C8F3P0_9BACT|nr:ABC transporter permease [Pseudodesulfovibrio profundus]SOB57151.1 Inner-membrane translocator [Pseudodesulfovibrio profundus]
MLKVRKREEPWKWGALVVFLGALLFSLVVSALLLAWQGKDPVYGMDILWQGSFGNLWALEGALLKAIPLFLCSLGVAVAFRMQIWNIGAEGQFALGAIGATWVALGFPNLPGYLLLPMMFIMAFILGGLWAVIPALLKMKLRVNEIISTLMLNYIAILLLDYLVFGVWKDPTSFGFPMTPEFTSGAVISGIGDSRVHWGLLFCMIVGIGLWAFMSFTRLGYELKASGQGARVAKYAKIRYGFLVVFVMALSGGFAGWAGCIETSAVLNRLQPSLMVGYGYTAIVVAWLARLEPLNIAFASFLLAALRVGVENMQLELQIPAAFGVIMEGMILLMVLAGQFFILYKLERKKSSQG